MCIDIVPSSFTAEKPFPVWKVLVKYKDHYFPAFYYPNGEGADYKAWPLRTIKLTEFAEERPPTLGKGGVYKGYACFESLELAEKFIEDCKHNADHDEKLYPLEHWNILQQASSFVPIKFMIPTGAQYGRGHIVSGYFGAGLEALVAERLVVPKPEVTK